MRVSTRAVQRSRPAQSYRWRGSLLMKPRKPSSVLGSCPGLGCLQMRRRHSATGLHLTFFALHFLNNLLSLQLAALLRQIMSTAVTL